MQKQFNDYMQGNLLFLQAISTRDKNSGLYLPLMDGNLNVTLNRIYVHQHLIDSVSIMLPAKELLDPIQFTKLIHMCTEIFNVNIKFVHTSIYGENIEKTRKNMMNSCSTIELYIDNAYNDRSVTIINDFPIQLNVSQHHTTIYNYNWSYCSDDETSEILKSMHFSEKLIALHKPTFLYSDIQLDYWKRSIDKDAFDLMLVQRSTNIFSRLYLTLVANKTIEIAHMTKSFNDILRKTHLQQLIKEHNVIFYPSRIEDPRYKFENVIKIANANSMPIIITNPTNYDMSDLFTKNPTLESMIIDLSEYSEYKRELYFYILSLLKKTDYIYHFEKDMHISLIEQTLLTNASIITPYISAKQIKSYINE